MPWNTRPHVKEWVLFPLDHEFSLQREGLGETTLINPLLEYSVSHNNNRDSLQTWLYLLIIRATSKEKILITLL